MILGVDHIALSCTDVQRGVALLEQAGYRPRFVQQALPNHPAKQPLLRTYDPLHAVAYCRADQGVALELTRHAHPLQAAVSPYQVLLNGASAAAQPVTLARATEWDDVWRSVAAVEQPVTAEWADLHAQFWYDAAYNQGHTAFVRAILLPVAALQPSAYFWVQGLGWHIQQHGTTTSGAAWMSLVLRAPVAAWRLELVLLETADPIAVPYLDDAGFPCLALMTNNLAQDCEKAVHAGGQQVCDNFTLTVAEKTLSIGILRGPDGELVELIEFVKQQV
jgi:hypothetical protein